MSPWGESEGDQHDRDNADSDYQDQQVVKRAHGVPPAHRPLPGRRCKRLSPADVEGLQLVPRGRGATGGPAAGCLRRLFGEVTLTALFSGCFFFAC